MPSTQDATTSFPVRNSPFPPGGAFDVTLGDVEAARDRLRLEGPPGLVRRTPTHLSEALGARIGHPTYVKMEALQSGGSFKLRGALNRTLQLSPEARAAGLVAVSGGNHAISVALAARHLGLDALILMAKGTPRLNIELTERNGARVELCENVGDAFTRALAYAERGRTLIHPFDDPDVIAGQGTVGLEFAEDAPTLTHVFVSIGGGGLIAGVAAAMRGLNPDLRIIGVETEGADTMGQALRAGHPVTIQPTSIARTLGAPYVTERTLAAARELVDEVVLVSDADAVASLSLILETERVLCEPAAACVLAAAAQVAPRLPAEARVGLVLCGANTSLADVVGWVQRFAT